MFEDFHAPLSNYWTKTEVGGGSLDIVDSALRMEVEARSSLPAATSADTKENNSLRGTAGFGFWNYPFSARGDILMLPEAVWFFYASPPSNMALVPGIPGWGWKAQVVHT